MGEGILSKEELNKLLGKEDDLLRKSGRAVESSGKLGKERLYMRELFFCELKDRFFHMIPYRKKKVWDTHTKSLDPGLSTNPCISILA